MSHIIKDANSINQTFSSQNIAGELVPEVIVINQAIGQATETTLAALESKIDILLQSIYDEDSVHTSGTKGQLMLAIRSDNDAPTAADGEYTILKLDGEGRLKVSSKPATYADVVGDITAIQPHISSPIANATVVADVNRASNVMIFCTGTFAGINVTFEGSLDASGDANWFGLQAVRSNANAIEVHSGVLGAAPAYAWELSVNALARFRVRATARTSGTQSWRFKLGTFATEPIPAAQVSGTQPVTMGSTTVMIGASGISAFAESSTNLGASATFTGTSRDGGVWQNVQSWNKFVAKAFADVAGTFRIEQSADNTTWRRATADVTVAAGAVIELVTFAIARYHRIVFVNGAAAQTQFLANSAYLRL